MPPLELDRTLAALADPADAAGRLGAAAALARWLQETLPDSGAVAAALQAHPDLVAALVAGLGDRHKGVQVHCAECLEVLAHFSPEVLPALHGALTTTDAWHSWGAAIVLARLQLWREEMGPALAGALGSADRDVRWAAANLLLRLAGVQGEPVTAVVMEAVRDLNPTARKMAAYLLGELGARGLAGAEAALLPLLADAERDVRRAAILALDRLGQMPPATRERIAAMATADPDEFVRRTAGGVLQKRRP